jgi:excisionase family DNA binding protein
VDSPPELALRCQSQIQKVIGYFQKVIGQDAMVCCTVGKRSAKEFLALTVTRGGQKVIPQTDKLDEQALIPKRPPVSDTFVPEPLLDTDQAAAIMRIHPKTLQKLARRGVIRAIQIGKVWRFRASTLEEWIQQKLAG